MFEKILVINLGGIGDVLLSTPALRSLKTSFPQARLYLLVVRRVYELAADLEYIDEVFVVDIGLNPKKIYNNLKTLLALRKRKIDIAINMRTIVSRLSAFKIKFLFQVINPKVKAGRNTMGRASFFDVNIPETDVGEKQEMEYDIELARALGAKVIDKKINLNVDGTILKSVSAVLRDKGVSSNDLIICIHPGGAYLSRRWAIRNFARVIEDLNKKIACKFIITGLENETTLTRKLENALDIQVINLVGKLGFKEMCALISRCSIFISNDTGPMHIAAVLKVPQVAIFGPGDIKRYDPRHISDQAIVLYESMICSPCNKVICMRNECLTSISPQRVTEAALVLLKINSIKV